MKITLDLYFGPNRDNHVTKSDMQENIDSITRAIDGKPIALDTVLMHDTRSILEAIQKQLPD